MPTLTVPTPTLTYEAVAGGRAPLEGMIEVRCGPPTFPDGSPFRPEDQGTAGFLAYRLAAAGALWEVWSEAAQGWQPSGSGDAALPPQPLSFTPGDPQPWQGILAAAGQPRFVAAPADTPFPRYAVRAVFAAERAGQPASGLSAPTPPLTFINLGDAMRVGLGVPPGQEPLTADALTIFLRNPALATVGTIEITTGGGSAEIVVANQDGAGNTLATLRLTGAGEIRLEPAGGQRVVIAGPLDAEQITYRPLGGGVKVTL